MDLCVLFGEESSCFSNNPLKYFYVQPKTSRSVHGPWPIRKPLHTLKMRGLATAAEALFMRRVGRQKQPLHWMIYIHT